MYNRKQKKILGEILEIFTYNFIASQDRLRSAVPQYLLQLLLLPKAVGTADLSGE